MLTEDDLGKALREGTMTVDDVVAAVAGEDQVFVYPIVPTVTGDATWDEQGEAESGSTLFTDLAAAGATQDQMDQIGTDIERLRAAGHTIDKVFGTVEGEPLATTTEPANLAEVPANLADSADEPG